MNILSTILAKALRAIYPQWRVMRRVSQHTLDPVLGRHGFQKCGGFAAFYVTAIYYSDGKDTIEVCSEAEYSWALAASIFVGLHGHIDNKPIQREDARVRLGEVPLTSRPFDADVVLEGMTAIALKVNTYLNSTRHTRPPDLAV
ncbi:MAG: hypothetical protein AABZ53_15060 [Planctomycetota bacterium]